jgi:hypothetical protein
MDGSIDDGGSSSSGLCATYPHGSANRAELRGGQIIKPASNNDGILMFFKSIVVQGDGTYATIGIYPSSISSPPTYYGFQLGQTQQVDVPGSTGSVSMQACIIIGQPCSVGIPGGTISGDSSCIFVIAADKPFAPPK